jgi:hypothetical protein
MSRAIDKAFDTGYNVIVEADQDRDDAKASEVMAILCEAYPGHPWHVRIGGGVIMIKHLKMSNGWGMCKHYDDVTFDAKVLKREIVFAAGEFLERANLRRGKADADLRITGKIDGIPQKHRVIH